MGRGPETAGVGKEGVSVDFVRVGTIAEVPEGELRPFELPTGRVAVAHFENEVLALGDECTHAGCSLSEGTLSEREPEVECPCHASVFDLRTGEPLEGPADEPVPVYPARIVDGWIEVSPQPGAEE